MRDRLAPLLGDRVTSRVYDRLGHGVSEESLRDLSRWLTERLDRAG